MKSKGIKIIVLLTAVMIVLITATAVEASEGEALRRIDTSNVNKVTDVRAIGEHEAAEHEAEVGEESAPETEVASHEAVGGEQSGESEHEEEHHPSWQITGWQSIFTVLAAIYFGLGVTLLPHIMAKEEH
jgi:hypothetical protein